MTLNNGSKLSYLALILTLFISSLVAATVPFGNDTAAHLHLVEFLRSTKSLTAYDPWWYFGKVEFVGYSLAYYPLAALTNVYIPPIIALSSTAALITKAVTKRALSAVDGGSTKIVETKLIGFVVICSVNLAGLMLTGAYPFLTSLPFFVLASLTLISKKNNWIAYSSLIVIGALFSIIATLWVGTLLVTIGTLEKGKTLRDRILYIAYGLSPLALVAIFEILSTRNLFPKGSYPFYFTDLLELSVFLILIAITSLRISWPSPALAAALYLAGSIVNFVLVRSSLGGNIARIGEFAPLITASIAIIYQTSKGPSQVAKAKSPALLEENFRLSRFRSRQIGSLLVVMAIGSALWYGQFTIDPLVDPSAHYLEDAGNWAQLASVVHKDYGDQRIEYVDTTLHEGAYFLPKYGVAIARGWFRQSDQPDNSLFYTSNTTFKKSYKSWLCDYEIAAVVLPPGPYDYSSVDEASLVKGGLSFLKIQDVVGKFRIYTVEGCKDSIKVEVHASNIQIVSRYSKVDGIIPIHFAKQLQPLNGLSLREVGGLASISGSNSDRVTIHF
ncbi:MAG: hypothetical protein M0019_08505 [Actinomycetota bacterium]|nr:hypothetical protein [Actinomycetota bacterium]